METALYLDTSAVLRATLDRGGSAELASRISSAGFLITSRLAQVEASRALLRARGLPGVTETQLADVERDIDVLWTRCELWELSPSICQAARHVAPGRNLRALDALHLATFLAARRHIAGLELLSADLRLQHAAQSV